MFLPETDEVIANRIIHGKCLQNQQVRGGKHCRFNDLKVYQRPWDTANLNDLAGVDFDITVSTKTLLIISTIARIDRQERLIIGGETMPGIARINVNG